MLIAYVWSWLQGWKSGTQEEREVWKDRTPVEFYQWLESAPAPRQCKWTPSGSTLTDGYMRKMHQACVCVFNTCTHCTQPMSSRPGSSSQVVPARDATNKSWTSTQTQRALNDVSLLLGDKSLKATELLMALNHSNSCTAFFLFTDEAVTLKWRAHIHGTINLGMFEFLMGRPHTSAKYITNQSK